ncbi:MAG: hypothetical protein Q9174_005552 [Haloplaca sp. 1 TL-2023]
MYRAKNPSLHYYVWDNFPTVPHVWSVLAYVPLRLVADEYKTPLINVFEMMGTLLFQTLQSEALDKYLDPYIMRTPGRKGLNVALPISQGKVKKKAVVEKAVISDSPQDLEPAEDLDAQELTEKDLTDKYWMELRAASKYWTNSDDPLIRAFSTSTIESGSDEENHCAQRGHHLHFQEAQHTIVTLSIQHRPRSRGLIIHQVNEATDFLWHPPTTSLLLLLSPAPPPGEPSTRPPPPRASSVVPNPSPATSNCSTAKTSFSNLKT